MRETKDKIITCPYCKSSFLDNRPHYFQAPPDSSLYEKLGRYELALRMYADKSNWYDLGSGYSHCRLGSQVAIKALEVKDE